MATPIDTQRLARVLEMLRSSHDGEVASAARVAHKMLTEAGMTWTDLAEKGTGQTAYYKPAPDEPKRKSAGRTYSRKADPPQGERHKAHKGVKAHELVTYLMALPETRFTNWEVNFIRSLNANCVERFGKNAALTGRQWELLWEIGRKVGAIAEGFAA